MGIQNYAQVGNSGNPVRSGLGTEAVDPVEVGLKSPRIELANIEHNGGSSLKPGSHRRKTRASPKACGRLSQEDSEVL